MFPSIELSWGILTRLIERLNQLSGLSTPLAELTFLIFNSEIVILFFNFDFSHLWDAPLNIASSYSPLRRS